MDKTTSNTMFQKAIEAAISEKKTAFLNFGEEAKEAGFESEHYFIDGEKVEKETFILASGMEHLLPDRTTVKCTQCGRNEKPELYKNTCGSRILEETCRGIFF